MELPAIDDLPLPGPGDLTRVRRGRLEFVLERARGSWLLVVHDGAQGRRYHIGLPRGSRLELRPAVPELGLDVLLEDSVALAPGGRVRGSVVLPLPTRLVWVERDGGREDELLCILPREYSTHWIDGEARVQCPAAFLPKGTTPWSDDLILVPLTLRNDAATGVQPDRLPIGLTTDDLRPCRGRLVARPRRIVHGTDGSLTETPRLWVGHKSATIHAFPG